MEIPTVSPCKKSHKPVSFLDHHLFLFYLNHFKADDCLRFDKICDQPFNVNDSKSILIPDPSCRLTSPTTGFSSCYSQCLFQYLISIQPLLISSADLTVSLLTSAFPKQKSFDLVALSSYLQPSFSHNKPLISISKDVHPLALCQSN